MLNGLPWAFLIFAIVLLLLFFWCLGAYGRLRRLRAQVHAAFAPLLAFRLTAPVTDWSRQVGQLQTSASLSWQAAFGQLSCAFKRAQQHPLRSLRLQTLNLAQQVEQAVWLRLAQEALHKQLHVQELAEQRQALQQQQMPLALAVNAAIAQYNHAIAQWPGAPWAWVFRFYPVVTLQLTQPAGCLVQRRAEAGPAVDA